MARPSCTRDVAHDVQNRNGDLAVTKGEQQALFAGHSVVGAPYSHAGGRGFESRRSRFEAPANRKVRDCWALGNLVIAGHRFCRIDLGVVTDDLQGLSGQRAPVCLPRSARSGSRSRRRHSLIPSGGMGQPVRLARSREARIPPTGWFATRSISLMNGTGIERACLPPRRASGGQTWIVDRATEAGAARRGRRFPKLLKSTSRGESSGHFGIARRCRRSGGSIRPFSANRPERQRDLFRRRLLLTNGKPPDRARPTGRRATLERMRDVVASSAPAPEKPALAADERAARLKLLAQRLREPDGLDRETLAQIEHLTANEP